MDDTYRRTIKNYYQSEAMTLDFAQPSTVSYLNDWCNEKTNGMVPTIIENLSPEAVLVLMNAIYFKAGWTEKFESNKTQDVLFTCTNGKNVKCPMMHQPNAIALYGNNDIFESLCLSFGQGDIWSMYFLLPNKGKTVDDVVNSLTDDVWNYSMNLEQAIVDIKIPRFRVENTIELNGIITQMGGQTMFTGDADYSLMSKNHKDIYVSKLMQKAAVVVSEEGAEASAVTVAIEDGSAVSNKKASFYADRPFVYVIREESTGMIFFIGTFQGE